MDDGIDDPAGISAESVGETAPDRRNADHEGNETVEQAVIAELERLLVAEGPMTVEQLTERLRAGSPHLVADLLADRPETALVSRLISLAQQADAFWRVPDGRLAPVLYQLRRATFTHRLTAGELEQEAVEVFPDLIALALPRSFVLSDGTELKAETPGHRAPTSADQVMLTGPSGWLSEFAPGDLLAVGYDGERGRIEKVPDTAVDEASNRDVAEALRQTFDELRGERAPELHRLVVDTMGMYPTSFAVPVTPLSELLDKVGLSVRQIWVGPAEGTWLTPPESDQRHQLEHLLTGARGCCQQAAHRALDAWHAWLRAAPDSRTVSVAAGITTGLAEDVGHECVAAVLAEAVGHVQPRSQWRLLGRWAGQLAAAETTNSGLELLCAVGADAAGDTLAAEQHLQRALEAEPDHSPSLEFLAQLVQDRGDAPRSLALQRRAYLPLGPERLHELEPFLVSHRVGRNEPCPCGSGRKFKACCSGRSIQRPLTDRCEWLLKKAARFAFRMDPDGARSLQHLFGIGTNGGEITALIADLLLFSSRGLDVYLETRGPLLPADELACARGWPDRPLRLLEIADAGPQVTLAVDVKTGDRLSVMRPSSATGLSSGATVIARPLPVNEEWILTSLLLPVPPTVRDKAAEIVESEVNPFRLLELLVDMQVDAIRL